MNKIHVGKEHVETSLPKALKTSEYENHLKEETIMKKMIEFYSYKPHLEQLLPILLKKSKISLRILDYFVTNYSAPVEEGGYAVEYNIKLYGRTRRFNVYGSYKAQLDAFHKKLFDPFCRRRRIFFEYAQGNEIETTPGQLNFFRWAIQNNVLEYVETHLERIQTDMTIRNRERLEEKQLSEGTMSITDTDTINDTETDANAIDLEAELTKEDDGEMVAKISFSAKKVSKK